MAIKFLGKKYKNYRASEYLKELDKLNGASEYQIDKFRYKALVVNNPELKFDKILFRASGSSRFPSNWQGNSMYLRKSGKESTPKFKDELKILNIKDQSEKTVYKPTDDKEGLMDICLDYSGKKFLYSGVDFFRLGRLRQCQKEDE